MEKGPFFFFYGLCRVSEKKSIQWVIALKLIFDAEAQEHQIVSKQIEDMRIYAYRL